MLRIDSKVVFLSLLLIGSQEQTAVYFLVMLPVSSIGVSFSESWNRKMNSLDNKKVEVYCEVRFYLQNLRSRYPLLPLVGEFIFQTFARKERPDLTENWHHQKIAWEVPIKEPITITSLLFFQSLEVFWSDNVRERPG